jgi:hypothetical protein
VSIRLLFEPRDLWVGLFIKDRHTFYLCLVPALPLLIRIGARL